jgi:hypothetical protein
MDMFIVGILGWWYGAGWKLRAKMLKSRLTGLIDYFSIDLLIKTLFSPFRQISAETVNGSINVQLRAFFDKLFSRVIGAIIRIGLILVGTAAIVVYVLLGILGLIIWALVPLIPLAGVGLSLLGWLPWIR